MNPYGYTIGVDAIGALPSGELEALLARRPLSADDARRLIARALERLAGRQDEAAHVCARMLDNMRASIDAHYIDPLPEAAADVLRAAVRGATGGPAIVGRSTMGPRGRVVLGVASWDNTQTYTSGSYCYNDGHYYRALRDVTPPFLPSLQAGDVPGQSDAWREVSAAEATGNKNVLGDDGYQIGANPNITDWDKTSAYSAGTVVRYWGQWYKALQDVPSASVLWGNDTPDQSSAWHLLSAQEASTAIVSGYADEVIDAMVDEVIDADDADGEFEVLGMLDIGAAQLKMNALPKQLPAAMAQPLLKYGQQVIDQAIELATEKNLPGPTARKEVKDHLAWHANELGKLAMTPSAIYGSAADLEHWVMEAFIESNAVEEGAAWVDGAWDRMWAEIEANLAALPAKVQQAVQDAANYAVETTTGLPLWAWSLIIAGGVAALGYGAYKILQGPAGGAIVSRALWR